MLQRFSISNCLTGNLLGLRLVLISFALGLTAVPHLVTADEVHWSNSAGGNYHIGGNWIGGKIPNAGDGAVFDLHSSGYVVTSDTDIETSSLTVRDYDVTLSLGNGTWRMPQVNTLTMFVGKQAGDVATLELASGTLEAGRVRVGDTGDSQGTLIVAGSTSRLALFDSALFAGGDDISQGTIVVRDAGQVILGGSAEPNFYIAPTSNSSGNVEITGANSVLEVVGDIFVGERGEGSLEVLDSAHLKAGRLIIGGTTVSGDTAAQGTVLIKNSEATISGQLALGVFGTGKLAIDNSVVTNQTQLQVGSGTSTGSIYGDGELIVQNGGVLKSFLGPTVTSATIAPFSPDSSGSVVVTGTGSKWIQDGVFSIGSLGSATLRIEDQGYVESKDAQVARTTTASAEVLVDGDGSLWVTQDRLIIGGAFAASGGAAAIDVSNQGIVEVGQLLHLWEQGTLDVSQEGGVIVGDPASPVDSAVLITNGGTLSGTGTIIGDVLADGGVIAPGASPGVLHIDGDLTVGAAGQLLMELGGLTSGVDYDRVDVTGNIMLDGLVTISLINGFVPSVGDQFTLFLVGGQFHGDQAQFAWQNAPPGLSYDSTFVDGGFALTITAVPEPSTWVLAGSGMLAGSAFRRHRRGKPASPVIDYATR